MAERDKMNISYETHGKQTNPCVILIHGLGLNKQMWQWIISDLRKSYYVISYDLYGHGDSSNPDKNPSLSFFSKQIADLLALIKIKNAILIGFSLGGMICRRFAQDYASKTNGIVILNSPYKRDNEAQSAILKRLKQLENEGPKATVEDALIRWFSDDYREKNPEMMNLVRGWVMKNDPKVYPKIYEVLVSGLEEISAPNPKLACPALVITADEDFGNGPKMSEAIASEIPNSKLVILKGLRHMALAEAPNVVNEPIKEFLNLLTKDKLTNGE